MVHVSQCVPREACDLLYGGCRLGRTQVMQIYAEALKTAAEQPGMSAAAQAGAPVRQPAPSFLAAAGRQVAAAQADAARDLLLLLAYVGTMRSLGTFTFGSMEWQAVQSTIIPKVSSTSGSIST
jgi:hypothetical protein